jgi:hypothetical protein
VSERQSYPLNFRQLKEKATRPNARLQMDIPSDMVKYEPVRKQYASRRFSSLYSVAFSPRRFAGPTAVYQFRHN